jgi:hypothetical protein
VGRGRKRNVGSKETKIKKTEWMEKDTRKETERKGLKLKRKGYK